MLDDIRTMLYKRAFLQTRDITPHPEEIDKLLEQHYGPDWKKVFGVDVEERKVAEREKAEQVDPITPYVGKSQNELNEEFFQKEKDEALEKARKDWQKKQRAKARRAKAEAKKKEKEKK